MSKSSLSKYEDYAKEVTAALGTRQEQKMSEFFAASRRSGESVLAFFARLLALYQSSNSFENDQWQEDNSHVTALYAKLTASLYSDTRDELRRRAEPDMLQKTLTITKLKRFIMDINSLRIDKHRFEAEKPRVTVIDSEKPVQSNQDSNPEKKETEQAKVPVRCWGCGQLGHYRSQCKESGTNESKESAGGRPASTAWRGPSSWPRSNNGFRPNRPAYGFRRGGFRNQRGGYRPYTRRDQPREEKKETKTETGTKQN